MNVFARSLAFLAIIGHIGLTTPDAFAAAAASSGHGGPAAGQGVSGAGNGHYGGAGVNGGHEGAPAPSPPSHSAGGSPVFGYASEFVALAAASGACGMELQLPDTSWNSDPIEGIDVISKQTQNFIASCGCNTQTCVADALEKYASALEQAVAPPPSIPGFAPSQERKLPRVVRDLPRIVREAATRVRAAKTPHAAQKAVQTAIETVQKVAAKTISLMRATDPDAKSPVTRAVGLVADTLNTAETALLRADTL